MKYYLFLFVGFLSVIGFAQNPSNNEIAFALIEKVPVFPGCEKFEDNESLKNCMSMKISEHIVENFDLSFAGKLGLEGRQRIEVRFTIDKQGNVTDINARGPHPRLEEEANRALMSLPQMTPGEQKGIPVGVLYSMPIVFDVE